MKSLLIVHSLNYSSSTPVIVTVIVALAEELFASVWLVVMSLPGVLVLGVADADELASIITSTTKAIIRTRLFILTTSLLLYDLLA
jgi:hypothetical protein